jgi:hypothetical protein
MIAGASVTAICPMAEKPTDFVPSGAGPAETCSMDSILRSQISAFN